MMKKIIFIMLIIVVFSFTLACSGASDNGEVVNNNNMNNNETNINNANFFEGDESVFADDEPLKEEMLIGSWSWPVPMFEEGTPNISGFLNYSIRFEENYNYFYYDENGELVEEGLWTLKTEGAGDNDVYYTLILKVTNDDGVSEKYYSARYESSTGSIELSFMKQILNGDEDNPIISAAPIIFLSRIEG